MKSIIVFTTLLIVDCIQSNQALQCFQHEICSTNCPQLVDTIRTCSNDENACYKSAVPGGVVRGCARDRCNVQINANPTLANVCCEKDLCNKAWKLSSSISWNVLLVIIGNLILTRTNIFLFF